MPTAVHGLTKGAALRSGLGVLAVAAVLGACTQPHQAHDPSRVALPGAGAVDRKAGLWEQRVSDGKSAQVTRLCLDAAAHRAMAYLGDSLNRDLCSKHEMTLGADGGWRFSSTCVGPGHAQVTTAGTASGDFTANYQLKLERSQVGGASPGVQRYVVDAAWKGPCPSDMKPGDMVLADGRKAAISQVTPSNGS